MSAVVLRGDARQLPLPDASVDLIVTSPPLEPYFGLRSYTDGGEHYAGQVGSEPTPQEWLDVLLECTAEWVRVLKPEGSLFVNLADKFAAGHGGSSTEGNGVNLTKRVWEHSTSDGSGSGHGKGHQSTTPRVVIPGTRPKSLLGLPWRYAIGCTDRLGLILRRDIIWHKPNGLPESVTDRCRSSHEYLFHLVKQPRYYAAVDEIRTPASGYARPRDAARAAPNGVKPKTFADTVNPLGALPGSVWHIDEDRVWTIPSAPLTVPPHLGVDHFAAFPPALVRPVVLGWSPPGVCTACGQGRRPVVAAEYVNAGGRGNERYDRVEQGHGDVAMGAFKPQEMRFGRANRTTTITGYVCGCTPYTDHPGTGKSHKRTGNTMLDGEGWASTNELSGSYANYERVGPWREYHLDRWQPPPTRPAVVLDPFGGTGTTALVASVYGRTGISVDLSADYCRLAQWRTQDPGERARALDVPKPPKQVDGQASLFDDGVSAPS